jgi:hypothetical protein
MRIINVPALLAVTLVVGCGTNSVTLSTLPEPAGRRVTAEVSKFSPLWLSPLSLEKAAELLTDLNDQCGGTGVTGITTRTSITWVVIGQIEKVEVVGYCRPESSANSDVPSDAAS